MPPRLPRLTLFTGPNCSLCQVAKAELARVRITHPFDLKTIDIHSKEGARWKNQYAWWIPALHLEDKEIAKGRWDGTVVQEIDVKATSLFYIDDRGMTPEELAWTAYWGGYVYDRNSLSVLGADNDVETAEALDSRNRCFNCGSTEHSVSACGEPLDKPLIALSRGMYNFFRHTNGAEPERLHEYEERRAARLRLCDTFEAGIIRGGLLRDALGLGDSGDDENGLPWFERMLRWGYPPGWVSDEDPKAKMRARIQGGDALTDDSDAVLVIDTLPLDSDTRSVDVDSCTDSGASSPSHEVNQSSKRWVHYPTSLFSSEKLQVYLGSPLPPVTPAVDSTFTPQRRALWDRIVNNVQPGPHTIVANDDLLPPWRRPGAFGAFGPAGWQESVDNASSPDKTHGLITAGCYSDANQDAESDMDVSD